MSSNNSNNNNNNNEEVIIVGDAVTKDQQPPPLPPPSMPPPPPPPTTGLDAAEIVLETASSATTTTTTSTTQPDPEVDDNTPPWKKELLQRRKAKSVFATTTKEVTTIGPKWTPQVTTTTTTTTGSKKSTNFAGISGHLTGSNNKMPVVGLHGTTTTPPNVGISNITQPTTSGHYTAVTKQKDQQNMSNELNDRIARINPIKITNNNFTSSTSMVSDLATPSSSTRQVEDGGNETKQARRRMGDSGSDTIVETTVIQQQIVSSGSSIANIQTNECICSGINGGGGASDIGGNTNMNRNYASQISCLSGCSSICVTSRTCFTTSQQHHYQHNNHCPMQREVGLYTQQQQQQQQQKQACSDFVVVDGQPSCQSQSQFRISLERVETKSLSSSSSSCGVASSSTLQQNNTILSAVKRNNSSDIPLLTTTVTGININKTTNVTTEQPLAIVAPASSSILAPVSASTIQTNVNSIISPSSTVAPAPGLAGLLGVENSVRSSDSSSSCKNPVICNTTNSQKLKYLNNNNANVADECGGSGGGVVTTNSEQIPSSSSYSSSTSSSSSSTIHHHPSLGKNYVKNSFVNSRISNFSNSTNNNNNNSNNNNLNNNNINRLTVLTTNRTPNIKTCQQQEQQQQQQHQHQRPTSLPSSASFDSSVTASKDSQYNSTSKMVAAQDLTDTFDLDTSEELQYGPGIVSRLRCRYLSLALRQSNAKQRPSLDILRRATSLNNLLNCPSNGNLEDYQQQQNQRNSLKIAEANSQLHHQHPAIVAAAAAAAGGETPSIAGSDKNRSPDEFVATFKKNLKISEKDKQRSRYMQRGNDSLKRARSVETLLDCDNKSSWESEPTLIYTTNTNNKFYNQYQPQLQPQRNSNMSQKIVDDQQIQSNDLISISSAAEVTVEDKINNARERTANSNEKPPKRRPPIMDDTERPPQDLVKQTLKIFEASANRRGRGLQRSNLGGEVAAKVANYKSIIGQDRPPIFPKPPLSPKKTQNFRKNPAPNSTAQPTAVINNTTATPAMPSTIIPATGITNLDLIKKTPPSVGNNNNNNNNMNGNGTTTILNTASDSNKNSKKFSTGSYTITPAVHTAGLTTPMSGKTLQDEETPINVVPPQPLKRNNIPPKEPPKIATVKPSPKQEEVKTPEMFANEVNEITSKMSDIIENQYIINDEYPVNDSIDNASTFSDALSKLSEDDFLLTEPDPLCRSSPIIPLETTSSSQIPTHRTNTDIIETTTTTTTTALDHSNNRTNQYIISAHNKNIDRPSLHAASTTMTTLTPREIEKNLINEKKNEESSNNVKISSNPEQRHHHPILQQPTVVESPCSAVTAPAVTTTAAVAAIATPPQDGGSTKWQVSKKKPRPVNPMQQSQSNSMVFNFKDRKDIPDYIENDGLLFKRRRELPRPNESGFVLLGEVSLETSTDPDDLWQMGPASPCNIEFENAYILIDGKSSFRDRSKIATTLKVKFDDSLTTTFEYPSENYLTDETSNTTDIDHANAHEASGAADGVIVHGVPQYGATTATNCNNIQNSHPSSQIDGIVKSPGQKLLGSVSLGSSAPLGSYTPVKAQINTNFELGVTRVQPLSGLTSFPTSSPNLSGGNNSDISIQKKNQINGNQIISSSNNRIGLTDINNHSNTIINDSDNLIISSDNNIRNGTMINNEPPESLQYLKPATDDLTIVYSEGTKKTDLLY